MAFIVFMISSMVITALGFFVSPYILFPLYHIVPCAMFCVRKIGIVVPFGKVRNAEIIGDILLLLLGWFLHKLTWGGCIMLVILRAAFLFIAYWEDKHYIYIEEDI